jgi:hypothetical protein
VQLDDAMTVASRAGPPPTSGGEKRLEMWFNVALSMPVPVSLTPGGDSAAFHRDDRARNLRQFPS